MIPINSNIRREFDILLDKADKYPSHFNLECLAGFILDHPEIVNREELLTHKANREYRERIKI